MFVVLLPLLLPVWFNFVLINEPEGTLALALSLFPLSAPVAMTARLAAGDVPLWQPVVALAGLALTAYLFVLLGARVFSAGTLLSSESLSWRRLRGAVRTALRAE
jgi:ABC-2 type transport system permease protein